MLGSSWTGAAARVSLPKIGSAPSFSGGIARCVSSLTVSTLCELVSSTVHFATHLQSRAKFTILLLKSLLLSAWPTFHAMVQIRAPCFISLSWQTWFLESAGALFQRYLDVMCKHGCERTVPADLMLATTDCHLVGRWAEKTVDAFEVWPVLSRVAASAQPAYQVSTSRAHCSQFCMCTLTLKPIRLATQSAQRNYFVYLVNNIRSEFHSFSLIFCAELLWFFSRFVVGFGAHPPNGIFWSTHDYDGSFAEFKASVFDAMCQLPEKERRKLLWLGPHLLPWFRCSVSPVCTLHEQLAPGRLSWIPIKSLKMTRGSLPGRAAPYCKDTDSPIVQSTILWVNNHTLSSLSLITQGNQFSAVGSSRQF